MLRLLTIPAVALLAAACGSRTTGQAAQPAPDVVRAEPAPIAGGPLQHALPRAIVYRTNVPCPDKVVISLNADRTAVLSYPAPTDVSAASSALPLADGWWLDRRGMGPNPAFIDMTYSQYAALSQAPGPAELMKMIIPGIEVTEVRRLDMTPQQAAADTAAVNAVLTR